MGAPPEEPDPKVAKTGEAPESEMEDLAFSQRHAIGTPEAQVVVTVSEEQVHPAGQEPNRGWPPFAVM